jgi:ATP-dependent Lhr-like helicase
MHGASFFAALHEAAGNGYPGETVDALWNLVWQGLVTNDTFHALRAYTRPPERAARRHHATAQSFRSRRVAPPSAEGRWSLLTDRFGAQASATEWSAATAQQLLSRYGIVTREVAAAEGIVGGFSAVYDVLKMMEDAGRIRRGYFVGGVAATQFALPAALDLLRSLKDGPEAAEVVTISATDPANPYGTMLRWPSLSGDPARNPTRSVGAVVVLVDGALAAYISRGARQLTVFLPDDEPARSTVSRALSRQLATMAREDSGMLVAEINGVPVADHAFAPFLAEAGFSASAMGYLVQRRLRAPAPVAVAAAEDDA